MIDLKSRPIIDKMQADLRVETARLIDAGIDPHVAVVLVGEDEQSLTYIERKTQAAKEAGIILSVYHLEAEAPFQEIAETLGFLAQDDEVHGIVLQLPLPEQFSTPQVDQLIALIPDGKDVDGLAGSWQRLTYTSATIEALQSWQPNALPPMVGAVCSLLDHYHIELEGKKIVLVGKGRLVGRPLEYFFKKLKLEVVSVDETTPDILSVTQTADILITGTGEPDLITYQWVKEGAIVIDCAHDVHVDSVTQVAEALSPAKGGIGPLTVAWLLHNVAQAARLKEHHA